MIGKISIISRKDKDEIKSTALQGKCVQVILLYKKK